MEGLTAFSAELVDLPVLPAVFSTLIKRCDDLSHLLDDSYVEPSFLRAPENYSNARGGTGMCHDKRNKRNANLYFITALFLEKIDSVRLCRLSSSFSPPTRSIMSPPPDSSAYSFVRPIHIMGALLLAPLPCRQEIYWFARSAAKIY